MHQRGADFMRGLIGHGALRLDQPLHLVQHRIGVGGQLGQFVAVARAGHARFDMARAHGSERRVHRLHPAAQPARGEMTGDEAEAGDQRACGGESHGEPRQQPLPAIVAAPDDQPHAGTKASRAREHPLAIGQRHKARFRHFGRDFGPAAQIAGDRPAGIIGEEIPDPLAILAMDDEPIGDPRLQLVAATADIDVGETGEIGVDLPRQHRPAIIFDDLPHHQEQSERREQADQQRGQRHPAENRPEQARPSHGRDRRARSAGSLCPRRFPVPGCRTPPPACAAAGRH